MPQTILVVDDDPHIVRLVRSYLEKEGFDALIAHDGDAAMQLIRAEKPDLVILDLMLPGKDGWAITRWMREDRDLRAVPVIMLTARVDDNDKVVGLELGADDYVSKPFNPRELVARVRAVLRRAGGMQQNTQLKVGDLHLDFEAHSVRVKDRVVSLTPTEFDILHTLIAYPDRAFTRVDLIGNALGYAYEGMDRTIDSHIKNIRKKLAITRGEPGYIETVYGVGYKMLGER